MFPNTPEHMAKWIEDPPARKPGALMTKLGLTTDQIQPLVAYLQILR
jgi:cytochrome c2